MSEAGQSGLHAVPPWAWALMLLGGGGAGIGGMSIGGNHDDKCEELEKRVDEAESARAAMSASIGALTDVIKQCNPGNGWIE